MVEEIVAAERNVAHRLIEEFMLLANETVASHLEKHRIPSLYRVHEEPDPVKVEVFEEFISTLGYSLGGSPDELAPRDFQRLVEKIQGKPEEKPIAFLMLRTMQTRALRPGEPRALRPCGRQLHPFHVAHPPVPGSGRPPRAAGVAARHERRAARGARSRTCRRSRATPPSASAARPTPSASWCSGRRSASWPTRSATSSMAT